MKSLTSWEIIIEYGPTAADVYKFNVSARNSTEALTLAEKWADENKIHNPMFSRPRKVTEVPPESIVDDDYSDVIEWTPEEEEFFVNMISGKDTNLE